ncbi:DNA polymerase/3'-5' exonuclease PolX [Thermomicrobium sp. CFH 73360]|uniref:DNA polymerase/3'-5' exonuclease PolX n=1 Tax=Thermomicrobium sp. CFH 73360 TaxID=2951987 RepID=UPI0020776C83|nr:DNA polymerase/3'-5' exonuclease PolX [Thermomicrobium sp. CFH 73360]MCM8747195.1 DNA polymerase/3'-5' exonuclease PolX [Thermomicrobium sp. CFH 73360]
MRRNEEVALLLDNIAELLMLKNENPYRIRAYTTAAQNIRALDVDIEELARQGRLDEIPGVGKALAAKIEEYLQTGKLQYYEELKREVPIQAVDLLEVPGIGPARAYLLYEKLGITTIQELLQAAQEHKLRDLPGFGEKLEERIAREAARLMQRTKRLLLGIALPVAEDVVAALRGIPAVKAIDPAGSLRRMKETIGDIDILVGTDDPEAVVDAFIHLPIVKEVLAVGPTRPSILTREDLQVDLRVVAPDEYGSALLYFTGSKEHNIALRTYVQERGWKLSEYGLFDENGTRLASRTEEEIYRLLDMDWIPPELRENRGEIQAAREHRLPKLVEQQEIRGDLHAHTDWSDGHDSLERMVQAAIARGYEYLVISDHSPSLTVARGLTVERLRAQRELIRQLNECVAPFRILQGAEVNIQSDGTLDYPDEVLAELDVVIVSVHSAFDMPIERMTERVIRALANPHVDILGHPTGRLLNSRLPYEIDLDAVLDAAAEYGVAIEINGQPDRLDLPDVWVQRAINRGILIACTSDAHSTRQLDNMRWSIAMARRGWAESRHVLNTRSLPDLLTWLSRQRNHPRKQD